MGSREIVNTARRLRVRKPLAFCWRDGRWVFAALALMQPARAYAQQETTTPAGVPTGSNVPALAPGQSTNSLTLSVLGAYSSNVIGSTELRGLKAADFYVTPSANFFLARPLGLETIYLGGDVGYTAYAKDRVLDRSRAGLNGGAIGRLAVCRGGVNGFWNRAQADLLYYLPGPGQTATSLASDVVQNITGNVSATCGRTIGLAPTFSVTPFRITHSDQPSLDANGVNGNAGVAYQSPILGVVSLNGQYSDTTYPNRTILNQVTTHINYTVAGGNLSYTRIIGARLSGAFSLGYVKTSVNVSSGRQFSGISGNANFTYKLTPFILLSGDLSRQVSPSNAQLYSYELEGRYLVEASYVVGPRLNLTAGGYHDHQTYYAPLIPITGYPNQSTIEAVFGQASYQTVRRFQFGLRVAEQRRMTAFVGESYTATTVSLSANSTF